MEKELLEQLEGFEEDMKWLNKNYDRLKKEYPEEYVAVLNQKVVDHGDDLKILVARLEEKYPKESDRIAIKYITTKKVELIL
jgi:hypothetical protein